jgi:hypothetical protein
MLLAPEKPERLDQMKVQLGSRHGDAENPAFFLDLFRTTRRHIGGYATIHQIENEDRIPFLTFGRMDR